ncbi:hypothetical protein ACIBVL_04480 [Streptomyces sp. NPDC049687]|uniref:hypothetical protein n=1 Tax=Streptomyces sp. NPDC049687 TaxID=3365596 RepID=UPI0037BA452D
MTDEDPPPTPPASPAAADPAPAQQPVSVRIRQFAEAVGPTTLVTALLFYFGYIATRARYEYFGVPVDMTGRSNQDLMLDGLEVIYVPAVILFLAALALVGIHALVLWVLSRDSGEGGPAASTSAFVAYGFLLIGVLLTAQALIGVFTPNYETSVRIGIVPVSLAFGPAAVAYGVWIYGRQRGHPLLSERLARNGAMFAILLCVAGLFWASTQLAWAYGQGRGEEDVERLADRPEVVVDTRVPLNGLPTGVTETRVGAAGQTAGAYRYRYQGFRLLLASGGRLFLVTADWEKGRDQTVVLPYKNDIRVQLVPHGD